MKNNAAITHFNDNRMDTDSSIIYTLIPNPHYISLSNNEIGEHDIDNLQLWLEANTEDAWMWRIKGYTSIPGFTYVTYIAKTTVYQGSNIAPWPTSAASVASAAVMTSARAVLEPMSVYEMYFESESDALLFSLKWA